MIFKVCLCLCPFKTHSKSPQYPYSNKYQRSPQSCFRIIKIPYGSIHFCSSQSQLTTSDCNVYDVTNNYVIFSLLLLLLYIKYLLYKQDTLKNEIKVNRLKKVEEKNVVHVTITTSMFHVFVYFIIVIIIVVIVGSVVVVGCNYQRLLIQAMTGVTSLAMVELN